MELLTQEQAQAVRDALSIYKKKVDLARRELDDELDSITNIVSDDPDF